MGNKVDLHEKLRVRVLSLDVTEHGNYFTKESVEGALRRMDTVPLVADMSGDKFGGHNYKVKYADEFDRLESYPDMDIVGYVDDSCGYAWVEENGTMYLEIEAKVHKLYSHKFLDLFNKKYGGVAGHSMEIRDVEFVYDEGMGADRIDYFNFSGFCILGDEYVPAVSGSVLTYSLKEAGLDMGIEEVLKKLGLDSIEELQELLAKGDIEGEVEGEVGKGGAEETGVGAEESEGSEDDSEDKDKDKDEDKAKDKDEERALKELEKKLDKLSKELDKLVSTNNLKFSVEDVANILKYTGKDKSIEILEDNEEAEESMVEDKGIVKFSVGSTEDSTGKYDHYDVEGVLRGEGTVRIGDYDYDINAVLGNSAYGRFPVMSREDSAYIKYVFNADEVEIDEHIEGLGTKLGSLSSEQIHKYIPERKTTYSNVSAEAYDEDNVRANMNVVLIRKLVEEATRDMFSDFKESGEVVVVGVEKEEMDTPEKVLDYVSNFLATNPMVVKGQGVLLVSPTIFGQLFNAGDNSKGQVKYDGNGNLIINSIKVESFDMGKDVDMLYLRNEVDLFVHMKNKKVNFGGEQEHMLNGAITIHFDRTPAMTTGYGNLVAVTTGVLDLRSGDSGLMFSIMD